MTLHSVAVPARAAEAPGSSVVLDKLFAAFAPAQDAAPPSAQAQDGGSSNPLYPYAGKADAPARKQIDSYRTVCVRLCDGYYWPVSPAAPMSHFQHDRDVCEQSCEQPAKLYYQPAGDTNAGSLVSLDGQAYAALPKAYSYRKALSPACRCKPDPWSESEVDRHRQYALEAQPVPAAQMADAAAGTSPAADEDAMAAAAPAENADLTAANRAAAALAKLAPEDEAPAHADILPPVLDAAAVRPPDAGPPVPAAIPAPDPQPVAVAPAPVAPEPQKTAAPRPRQKRRHATQATPASGTFGGLLPSFDVSASATQSVDRGSHLYVPLR